MSYRFRHIGLIALLFAIMLAPATAFGQFDATDGIRFGPFSIHPSVLASVRYVDNIYFLPNDYEPENELSVPQELESDFIVNVQPAILFDVTIPTFTFQTGYRFYNDQFMSYDDPENQHHKLNSSNHTFNGLLDYHAPFGLLMKVQDTYTNQESFEESEDFEDFIQGEQIHNDARGLLGFAHGPEENLYIAYTYINIIDQYDRFNEFDKMTHMHHGEMKFKFFPRTAYIIRGGYHITDYDRIQDYDSISYWGLTGLRGQMTRHMILTLLGGYAFYDYQSNADGSGPIGQAELEFIFDRNTKLAFGYRRRFRDAVNTNYFSTDEGYLRFNRLWGSRVNTALFGSYQYNLFSEPFDRREDFIQANLDVTLRLIFWLYTGVGYSLDHKIYDDGTTNEITTRNLVLYKIIAQF